jgi:DNA-binding winged helix-turn-helix (wHTH) protein/uncharacterized DUF497 family protein
MDLESEELKKNGHILKLRSQPFRMLAIIAERNGDVITREELRAQLWPAATFGDYKHSLGNSLLEIRKVLHDSANNPEYVETVSRGYRFLKPVEFIIGSSANGNGSSHCHSVSLLIEIQQIRQELINTSDCRSLALLFFRCDGLLNQHPQDPYLPDLQLLMADIQSAIDRSAGLNLKWANPAISFETARLVFDDPNAISVPHRFGNGRGRMIGLVSEFVLLTVEYSVCRENGQRVVMIHGARRATPQERRVYEQGRK